MSAQNAGGDLGGKRISESIRGSIRGLLSEADATVLTLDKPKISVQVHCDHCLTMCLWEPKKKHSLQQM